MMILRQYKYIAASILTLTFAPTSAQYIPIGFWNVQCSNYEEVSFIEAPDKDSGDYFGKGASFSSDGSTLLVGAWLAESTDNGRAYVFTKSGSSWVHQATLNPIIDGTDTDTNGDHFGEDLSLSGDGNIAVVGSPLQENGGGISDLGAIYVYTRTGSTWDGGVRLLALDRQHDDRLGESVEISEDGKTIIAGAHNEDTGASNAGAAYIFVESSGTWSQQAKLTDSTPDNNDIFGKDVSISKDGNTVLIGTPFDDTNASNAGVAHIYTRTGTTWSFHSTIQHPSPNVNDYFGHSVSLSEDGTVALVSAYTADRSGISNVGASFIFRLSGGTYSYEAELIHSNLNLNDNAGKRSKISGNGKYAIIGAENEDTSVSNSGAAIIFKHKGGTTWEEVKILKMGTPSTNDSYGTDVAIDKTGKNIAVGADRDNSSTGSATVYKCK